MKGRVALAIVTIPALPVLIDEVNAAAGALRINEKRAGIYLFPCQGRADEITRKISPDVTYESRLYPKAA
jgi:hypothetical protein